MKTHTRIFSQNAKKRIFTACLAVAAIALPASLHAAQPDGNQTPATPGNVTQSEKPAPAGEDFKKDFALAWLALNDVGKYAESYAGFSEASKKMLKEKDWIAAMESVRKPLGDVVSRKLKTNKPHKTLPGVPDGEYRVLTFATEFFGKKNAGETLTFSKEKDGAWKVAGYFIK